MSIENQEIAEAFRRWLAAWNSADVEAIAQLEVGEVGFGCRALAWRGLFRSADVTKVAEMTRKFLDMFEYFHADLEELNTSAEGDIGLAWGFYVEKFKAKGRPPEQSRVRFSSVFKKEATGWRRFMYHRDIQPFDKEGLYVPQFTKV